ncbi:hypothetical protein [Methylobacterium sp. J-070]|uniref:hypothetical protein n=1 Tax=Methylobacterium sp. J-070 TaxID=2836650 RepID=UPI001FBB89B8|nr:hypothetical protein [Methylobacterium sp. J-070]MCJ2048940.1 hypothetical protein [Methylobacterium sp. J-070]
MHVMTDHGVEAPRGLNATRFLMLGLVALSYFATSVTLFMLSTAKVTTGPLGLPPAILVILACMVLSVASTGCYVFLQRRS